MRFVYHELLKRYIELFEIVFHSIYSSTIIRVKTIFLLTFHLPVALHLAVVKLLQRDFRATARFMLSKLPRLGRHQAETNLI